MISTARGTLYVLLAATMWGVSGAVAKFLFASRSVEPLVFVQVRMGLSFAILFAWLAVFAPGLLRIRRQDLGFIAIFGILGMASVQFTYMYTVSLTNVATAIFLQYLAPILTALYAWLVERQSLGPTILLCLAFAVGGSLLLVFGGTAQLLVSPLGLTTGLISAFCMSFYTIYGARGVGRFSPWTLLCYGLGTGFLFWMGVNLAFMLAGWRVPPLATFAQPDLLPFFIYIAVLATVVPFGLYLTGLKSITPTMAVLTGMLEPLVASGASFLLNGERLRPTQILGGALIVVAVILLQVRQQKGPARR